MLGDGGETSFTVILCGDIVKDSGETMNLFVLWEHITRETNKNQVRRLINFERLTDCSSCQSTPPGVALQQPPARVIYSL